jgi:hypothetical protein
MQMRGTIRTILAAIALTVALGVTASIASAQSSDWYGEVFNSPTRDHAVEIMCKYRQSLDSITCGVWPEIRASGRIVSMTSYGTPREGRIITWDGQAVHTLHYGSHYRGNGSRITCSSAYNGMRCTNHRGHGFFISRTATWSHPWDLW